MMIALVNCHLHIRMIKTLQIKRQRLILTIRLAKSITRDNKVNNRWRTGISSVFIIKKRTLRILPNSMRVTVILINKHKTHPVWHVRLTRGDPLTLREAIVISIALDYGHNLREFVCPPQFNIQHIVINQAFISRLKAQN